MSASKIFRRLRDLTDVTWGDPENRDAPLYNSTTGKTVMRAIVSLDISDATEVNLPNTVVKRDDFGFAEFGSLRAGNITSVDGIFIGDGSGLTSLNTDQISAGTLVAVRGGTGISTYAPGDIIYADGTDTLGTFAGSNQGLPQLLSMTDAVPAWMDVDVTNASNAVVRRNTYGQFNASYIKGQATLYVDASLTLEGGVDETGTGASVNIAGGGAVGEGLLSGGSVSISAGVGLNQSAPMTGGEALITVQAASGGDDGGAPFTTGGSIILTPGAGSGSGGNGNVIFARGNLVLSSGTVTATSFIGSGLALTGVALLASTNTFTARNTFAAGTITSSQPLTITQTLSAGAVTFNSLLINLTDSASAQASTFADFQIAGTSKFAFTKSGQLILNGTGSSGVRPQLVGTFGGTSAIELEGGKIIFQAGGANTRRLAISSTALLSNNNGATTGFRIMHSQDANSTTAPIYTFSEDTDTGITRSAANTLNIITGGASRINVSDVTTSIISAADSSSSTVATNITFSRVYSQSGTAGSIDLAITRTETGVGSGQHDFINCKVAAAERFRVSNAGAVVAASTYTGTQFFSSGLGYFGSNNQWGMVGLSGATAFRENNVIMLSLKRGIGADIPVNLILGFSDNAAPDFFTGTTSVGLHRHAAGVVRVNNGTTSGYGAIVASIYTSTQNGIGTATTDGIVLENTTAAAVGAQQISPRLRFSARGWKTTATAASQSLDIKCELVPVQGSANPTSSLIWYESINGAAYTQIGKLEGVSNSGNVTGGCYVGTGLVGIRADGGGRLELVTGASAALRLDGTLAGQMWGTMHLKWATVTDDGNLLGSKTFDVGVVRSGTNELTVSNGSTGRGNLYCNFLKTDQVAIGASAGGNPIRGYIGIKDASGNSKWVPYNDNADMTF